MSSILRSSKFVRYFVGLARNIVISNRQELDGTLLQRSNHVASVFSSHFSSTPSFKTGSTLDNTIRRLDEDARRMGRISFKEVEEALNEIRLLKKATTSQSLMVIRCCGNLVPEETPETRTKFVEEIWNTFEKLGVALDISHYNALLKVYLENEHKFSPTKFLAKLEKQGVEPNRVTYQRLIAGYCQMGDIAGATKILEFMKEKQLPVSEGVFNALIMGHYKADDMESAEGMLGVMRQASLEPSNETYTTLLCGYAKRGDEAAIERLITECKLKDVLISDKDFLEVAHTAALSGHNELVDQVLKNVRHMAGYNQDAANVLLRLLTQGKDDAAYKVFQTMQISPSRAGVDSSLNFSGHVIIKHLVKINRPVSQILSLCEKLEREGHTKYGLWLAVESSFHQPNIELTMELMAALKQKNQPIRNHYFWPSLITVGKAGNINGMMNILRRMVEEFDVPPSAETVKEYCLPYIKEKNPDQLLALLMQAGVRRGQAVVAILIHLVTQNKLKQAVDLALQHPRLNLRTVFQGRQLVDALQQTEDVASVVALVHIINCGADNVIGDREAVEGDEEAVTGDELPGRFLINVVSYGLTRGMTAQVLKEMFNRGLGISNKCAELVESRLPGNQLTSEISDLLAKLSSGDLSPTALNWGSSTAKSSTSDISRDPVALERLKERMVANNEGQEKLISITRSIYQAYCFKGDVENALRVKQEWVEDLKQEVTAGWWAQLLGAYTFNEDLEGAKECMESMKRSMPELELDTTKTMMMAKLYIKNNQFDEAINTIKNVKSREEKSYQSKAACWQALQAAADSTKDPERVKEFLNTLVDKKFIEISNVFLGPIIKTYLMRDDIAGALAEFEHCVKVYRATPWKNEITTRLIEKEDAVNLQTLVDLSTQVHGEINSLYDLVLSFVECGRIRQARKILETPGLRNRNNRLQSACERYKNEGLAAPLEGLVQATKDLPHIDRSEIYYNLLETYCQTDNVEKALGLWTQMQDEDVHVSDEFLLKLGTFMKSKGLATPFKIPENEALSEDSKTIQSNKTAPVKQTSDISTISAAINRRNLDEALKIAERLKSTGKSMSRNDLTKMVEMLVASGRSLDAAQLVLSQSDNLLPTMRTLSFLISRLSQAGELEALKNVGERLSTDMQKLTSFNNRYLTCAVTAGKVKEELDKLERQIDGATTPEEVDALAESFPRGGINGVLEASPSYHEQVKRIADKYSSKGIAIPSNSLCMFYLGNGELDKAKEIYQHYKIGNSSRIMFQHVVSKARITNNPKLIEDLISLIIDAPALNDEAKGIMYSNLINIYVSAGNVETALTKLEESLKVTSLDHLYYSTLIRLKDGLEAKSIPFKYTIPPKKAKDSSSSSSSSSDEQPKRSIAAKH